MSIIDKIVQQIFGTLTAIPKDEVLNAQYREKMDERKTLAVAISSEAKKVEDELAGLRAEVIRAICGNSSFSTELLGSIIMETEQKHSVLQEQLATAQKAYEESTALLGTLGSQYE